MTLQQSNYQALIVTRNGCAHSISTVIHDNEGKGIANSHGYTLHFDYNDFYDDGYAIDANGDPKSEYVDFAFLNDDHVFDKIERVLGKEVAVKVVYNVFQMTDWEQMMEDESVNYPPPKGRELAAAVLSRNNCWAYSTRSLEKLVRMSWINPVRKTTRNWLTRQIFGTKCDTEHAVTTVTAFLVKMMLDSG